MVISCEICEIFKSTFFYKTSPWLFLKVSGFQPATLLKKRLRKRCFSVNFAKFLRTSFSLKEHLRMAASCVYLWILTRFQSTLEKLLFYVQVAEFQLPDTLKNRCFSRCYFTGAFQAFYTKLRNSKAFILLKSLKTVYEEVNQMKQRDANLQLYEKKLFHSSSFMYFAFIFSEYITINSSEEALKVCQHNFFQEI